MTRSPIGPRPPRPPVDPTARSVLAGYVLVAAVPLVLWAAGHPLAGGAVLAVVTALSVVARRLAGLVRCLYDCGGFTIDPPGTVRITVSRDPP